MNNVIMLYLKLTVDESAQHSLGTVLWDRYEKNLILKIVVNKVYGDSFIRHGF